MSVYYRILAMLERAADAGQPCPTNAEITEALGTSSLSTAPDTIARLERDGLITVERGIRSRVVTIVATGHRTAGEITTPHWTSMGQTAREASNGYRMAVLNMMVRAADAGAAPPEYAAIAAELGISKPYANKIVLWLIDHEMLRRTERPLMVVISALATRSDIRSYYVRGADDFLAKPFATEELVDKVQMLLDERALTLYKIGLYSDIKLGGTVISSPAGGPPFGYSPSLTVAAKRGYRTGFTAPNFFCVAGAASFSSVLNSSFFEPSSWNTSLTSSPPVTYG